MLETDINKLRDNMEGFLKIDKPSKAESFVWGIIDTLEVFRDLIFSIFHFLFTVFSFFFIMYGFFTSLMSSSAGSMIGYAVSATILAFVYVGFYYTIFRDR